MRQGKGCLLHTISLVGLAAALFCLYRALVPIITLYADTMSDPLGNSAGDPDTKRIQSEAFFWAPIGVVCLIVSAIVSWIATAGWLKRTLSNRQ